MSVNTGTVDLNAVRAAFEYLRRIGPQAPVVLPNDGKRSPAGDAVECIAGESVSEWIARWNGRRSWTAGGLGKTLRAHFQLRLYHKLTARQWPLQPMINGIPTVATGAVHAVVVYSPQNAGDLMSFVTAVRIAADNSRYCQTKLIIRHAESCHDDVVEYMARLLNDGMTLADGTRAEYEPTRLALDLKLNPTNDAAWRLVDYILEYQKTNSQ